MTIIGLALVTYSLTAVQALPVANRTFNHNNATVASHSHRDYDKFWLQALSINLICYLIIIVPGALIVRFLEPSEYLNKGEQGNYCYQHIIKMRLSINKLNHT